MKADYVHKDSLTATGYDNFVKKQSIKESILRDTKDYGRTQFVDKIYELKRENQQLRIQTSAREENYNKLEDNWNKLKEYIEQEISVPMGGREFCCYSNIRDKIKELERGVSDEK